MFVEMAHLGHNNPLLIPSFDPLFCTNEPDFILVNS